MAHPTLKSDHVGTNPIIISERQCPTLTSDYVGTPPTTLLERPSTHICSTNDRNGPALTFGHARNQSSMPKGSTLTSDQPMIKESPSTYTWQCEEPILHAKRILHLYLINQWSKKGTTLIYDQPMIEERLSTYIWSTNDWRKDLHLHSTHMRNQSNMHVQ